MKLAQRVKPMLANVKRGFNRLFVVLTPIWVVYCLLVYPMQRLAKRTLRVLIHPDISCANDKRNAASC